MIGDKTIGSIKKVILVFLGVDELMAKKNRLFSE